MPAVSVSAGYNYLSGGINTSVSGTNWESFTADSDNSDLNDILSELTLSDPDLRFAWKTHSLDFKVQASKNLLIFTPYAGGAYTYGWSTAGGGVSSDLTYTGATEDQVKDALDAAGYGDVELSDSEFSILSDVTGGSVRAFGGFSVNLLVLKLDLNGQYNFTSGSLGGGINARIQL